MRFFVFKNPRATGNLAATDFLPADDSRTGEAPRCPKCGNFIGMIPLLPPVRVELEAWGNTYGDFSFGPGDEILVAGPLLDKLQAASVVGLQSIGKADIVSVVKHQNITGNPTSYHCCRPMRSEAVVDDAKSGIEWQEPWTCNICRLGRNLIRGRSIILMPGTWSGDDIFVARGLSGRILVSEKFKDVVEEAGATNYSLVPAEDFSFDFQPWRK